MDESLGAALEAAATRQRQSVLGNRGRSPYDLAVDQYPILKDSNTAYKENFQPGPNQLEYWPAGETGAPDRPRPQEFPMEQGGIEIFNKNVRPIDILGDVVSHQLIKTDPTVSSAYKNFEKSLTPDQNARLNDQYSHAQANEGETRPFEQWREMSGLPAYFRGYPFKQWPAEFNEKAYTPEQRTSLGAMMKYLSKAR